MFDTNLLTTLDLARRWRTTEQAIYSARHREQCPPAVRVGRRLLWRIEDVQDWEQQHREGFLASAGRLARPA